jgi:hypothetical protein
MSWGGGQGEGRLAFVRHLPQSWAMTLARDRSFGDLRCCALVDRMVGRVRVEIFRKQGRQQFTTETRRHGQEGNLGASRWRPFGRRAKRIDHFVVFFVVTPCDLEAAAMCECRRVSTRTQLARCDPPRDLG